MSRKNPVVLSLYPNSVGLCYAVFEGDLKPIDWGIRTARQEKHDTLTIFAARLLKMFSPAAIVLPVRNGTQRGWRRLQDVADSIAVLADVQSMSVHWISRHDIKTCFAKWEAKQKDAIARVIVGLMPEFEQHLPPVRKIWMSEDYRMGIFDAVSQAITSERKF